MESIFEIAQQFITDPRERRLMFLAEEVYRTLPPEDRVDVLNAVEKVMLQTRIPRALFKQFKRTQRGEFIPRRTELQPAAHEAFRLRPVCCIGCRVELSDRTWLRDHQDCVNPQKAQYPEKEKSYGSAAS